MINASNLDKDYLEKYRNQIGITSDDNSNSEEYLISAIIKGYSHIYKVKNEEESQLICEEEKTVKTKNLKKPPIEISKMENKICSDCFKKYKHLTN